MDWLERGQNLKKSWVFCCIWDRSFLYQFDEIIWILYLIKNFGHKLVTLLKVKQKVKHFPNCTFKDAQEWHFWSDQFMKHHPKSSCVGFSSVFYRNDIFGSQPTHPALFFIAKLEDSFLPIQGLQSFVVRNGFDAKYTHALLQDLQSRMMITRLEIGGKPYNFGHHHQQHHNRQKSDKKCN